MNTNSKGTAVITGASGGIGAVYAERLAHRGYDLIVIARNRERLEALATRLTRDTSRAVDVIVADLSNTADLARVEQALKADHRLTMLVNSAGVGSTAPLLRADADTMVGMIDLNITALVRLTRAVAPAFVRRNGGTIINISSATVWPDLLNGVYGATKAFVLAFSLSLHRELIESNVRVQVVLPGATGTGFWAVAGTPVEDLPHDMVMTVDDLVDVSLTGLDQGELVTLPSLPELAEWDAYEVARQQMFPKLSLSAPAEHHGVGRSAALWR